MMTAVTSTRRRVRSSSLSTFVARYTTHIVVILICVVWIIPAIGMLVTSFRTAGDAAVTGWWTAWSTSFSFDSYNQAVTQGGVGRGLVNSLLITLPANTALVFVAAVTSYVFGVMRFKGRDVLFLLIIAMMALPAQMTLAPLFALFQTIGLAGEFASLWIFQVGFSLPLSILILRNFFSSIPQDIFEAADVDGASAVRTFFSVALPLSLPGLFTVLIYQFIHSWNELLVPLVLIGGGAKAPVTVQIAGLATSASADNQTLVAAAALISLLIPLGVFFALQKYYVRGFLSGSVKG